MTYRQACGSVMQPLFFIMGSSEDCICSGYATNLDINIIILYQHFCFNLYYVARCYPLWMHKIAANKVRRYMSNRNLKSMYLSGRPYDNTFHNTATRFDDAFITLYHECLVNVIHMQLLPPCDEVTLACRSAFIYPCSAKVCRWFGHFTIWNLISNFVSNLALTQLVCINHIPNNVNGGIWYLLIAVKIWNPPHSTTEVVCYNDFVDL